MPYNTEELSHSEYLLTFYGDDFTGSTDVMESLAVNGIKTVLFLEPPDKSVINDEFGDVQAIGVAGKSRTMTPEEMKESLSQIYSSLNRYDSELFHYKVCSTFDSSPEIGNIGCAIELGISEFSGDTAPLVVAAPDLHPRGRYIAFGNLFATVEGTTYRLDRHPTMKNHPVTPMSESDLCRHLGEQTDLDIELVDVLELEEMKEDDAYGSFLEIEGDGSIVLFDTLTHDHQRTVGEVSWDYATKQDDTAFIVGSSGVEYALTDHWQSAGLLANQDDEVLTSQQATTVVVSGSASPVTADQIKWAMSNGFETFRLDSHRLIDPEKSEEAVQEGVRAALDSIAKDRSVILYTALGPADDAIEKTRNRAADIGITDEAIGSRLGRRQGQILGEVVRESNVRRICVAGGDTSGYVAPELDIYALEMVAPLSPGSPLCRAYSNNDLVDGLDVALKGGQVGQADFFGLVRDGVQ